MTDPNYTAIAMLTDRSGSMNSVADDAVGGINNFLAEQRKLPGKCTVRISQFDDHYEVVCESLPVDDVPEQYLLPRGMTALMDAWGKLITEFGEELAALPEDRRPGNVIFVVTTDGMENASKEWTRERLYAKVKEQQEKYGWQFLYLGADQDAVKIGGSYGVARGQTMSFDNTSAGNQAAYAAMTTTVSAVRTKGGPAILTPDED